MLLTKRDGNLSKPAFAPIFEREAKMGEDVPLPETHAVLWAEIEVPSTLLGSACRLLFKRPGLRITFRYPDGQTETFCYIEGMGRSGFLISPVVHDNADFVALHERRLEHFSGRIPVSFSLAPTRHGKLF